MLNSNRAENADDYFFLQNYQSFLVSEPSFIELHENFSVYKNVNPFEGYFFGYKTFFCVKSAKFVIACKL